MQKIEHIKADEYPGAETMQQKIDWFLKNNPNIEIQSMTSSKASASNKNSSSSLYILYKDLNETVNL